MRAAGRCLAATVAVAIALLAGVPVRAGVTVTHVANEGFLLSGGGQRVLVDALIDGGLPGYPSPPEAMRDDLEAGRGAFAGVDLVLVTHHHADHFGPRAVVRHLRANPRARLVSTPEVLRQVLAAAGGAAAGLRARVEAVSPGEGRPVALAPGGVAVEALALHHGRDRDPPVTNLGFVVELDGLRVLHVGDSEAGEAEFAALDLAGRRIDVALLPSWMLLGGSWSEVVTRWVRPGEIVAMHLPRREAPGAYFGAAGDLDGLTAAIRRAFPQARVALRAGEAFEFGGGAGGGPARGRAPAPPSGPAAHGDGSRPMMHDAVPETGTAALAAAVRQEVARLRELVERGLSGGTISGEARGRAADRIRRLERIAGEARAGRPRLALYRLADERNTVLADRYRQDHADEAAAAGSFEAWWRAGAAELAEVAEAPAMDAAAGLLVRALAEAAWQRQLPYRSASRPYAAATSEQAGLFYLGRARAHADFAAYLAGLELPAAGPAPELSPLAGRLERLERSVAAAYRPPLSTQRHDEFIALNASIKLARELEAAGARAGGLVAYLDALGRLGALAGGAAGPASEQDPADAEPKQDAAGAEREQDAAGAERKQDAAVRRALAGFRDRFEESRRDDGIGLLFVEMAEAALARAEDDRARALVLEVLPEYLDALSAGGAPAPWRPPRAEVTVTLVRWPYT